MSARAKSGGYDDDDCAIDNSNRLIIRPSAEEEEEEGEKAREKRARDRSRDRESWTARYFRGLSSSFFFFFFFPFPARRPRARTYTGFILGYMRYPSCCRETESEINFEGIIIYTARFLASGIDRRNRRRRRR